MTAQREVERVARRMYRDVRPQVSAAWRVSFAPWNKIGEKQRLSWRVVARWHLAQVKVAKAGRKTLREIMELIARGKRKTSDQQLASSCLTFLDAMADQNEKNKAKVQIHPCGCTHYNGSQCYNCLNGAHEICTSGYKCGVKNAKRLGVVISFKSRKPTPSKK